MGFGLRRVRRFIVPLAVVLLLSSASFTPANSATRTVPTFRAVPSLGSAAEGNVPSFDRTVNAILSLNGQPLARVYADYKKANGKEMPSKAQKDHVANLKANQAQVGKAVEKRGGKVIASYQKAYNGIWVQIRNRDLASLLTIPGVRGVQLVRSVQPDNETSVPFIGAPDVWESIVDEGGLQVTGEGVTVAIIDTGIDYTHEDFGGSGDPEDYATNDPDIIEEGTFPTAKVIGGWDFAGSDYDASSSDPARNTPSPDPDPLDEGGHGSHVAGTVAGFGTDTIGAGVAPDALLYALKVFGVEGSTGVTAQAIEWAMDPDGNGDMSDHVDVINMSLGSPFGTPWDVSSVAANNAVEAGVIVVASAGNEGDVPYITGSPGVASQVVSVAASIDEATEARFHVNSPAAIEGHYDAVEGAISLQLAMAGPITGDLMYVGTGCDSDATYDATGEIALIDRGGCTFSEKILNAQGDDVNPGGAIAAVVVNNASGDPIIMGGSSAGIDIPAVMIKQSDGGTIKTAHESGPVNVTMSSVLVHELTDTLADFTSRGPASFTSALKPDIAAPGYNITSVEMGGGTRATMKSGTSMATPHMTGLAALLRQLHPDWTVEELKALMMQSTTPNHDEWGNPYPVARQGTGRVQVFEAAQATAIATPASLSLGFIPISDSSETLTKTLTVANRSDVEQTYELSWEMGYSAGEVHISFSSSEVTIAAGDEETVDVTFTLEASELFPNMFFTDLGGYVYIDSESDNLRVPFHAVPITVSETSAEIVAPEKGNEAPLLQLSNDGVVSAQTHVFELVATDPDEYAAFAVENPELLARVDAKEFGWRTVASEGETQFVLSTYGPWSSPSLQYFLVYLDRDLDGVEDALIYTGDWYYEYGSGWSGIMVSFFWDFDTGDFFVVDFTDLDSTNKSVIDLPIPTDLILGSGGTVNVLPASYDLYSGLTDFASDRWILYDPSKPTMATDDLVLLVNPGETAQFDLATTGKGKQAADLLLVYNLDDPTDGQTQVVSLHPKNMTPGKGKGHGKAKGQLKDNPGKALGHDKPARDPGSNGQGAAHRNGGKGLENRAVPAHYRVVDLP